MLPDTYNLSNFIRAVKNPSRFVAEGRRRITQAARPIQNWRFRKQYGQGVDIIERDWDNLLIFDSCRYSNFEEYNSIDGELQSVVSRGSRSSEFLKSNFEGREIHDTVYITANPYTEMLSDDVFHWVDNLLVDHWNAELGTVPPDAVVTAAKKAVERFPRKRLIVHFMQPHTPWIGPTANRIRERLDVEGYDRLLIRDSESSKGDGVDYWEGVRNDNISEQEMHQAYRESIEIVCSHGQELINSLSGKSVVTADHGEMLGERIIPGGSRIYGHPKKTYTPELAVVPWLVVEGKTRRKTSLDPPVGFKRLEDDKVEDRLRALGYTE
ncbi:hypothetical protein [Halorubrum halophilum]|uniref:hypothetical protein n=1 Tax=Halorubrum halophilum TaxID=413816 RepID=UPI001D0070FE|nr:hypothetical protein [Halorubrum halophilum]